jgi:recombination protein RecA
MAKPSAPTAPAPLAAKTASHARDKNIELALSAISKQFGEGSIMRLGGNAKMKVETLSTGSLAIDLALGVGGLPKGRIVEIKLAPSINTYLSGYYGALSVCHNN